MSKSLGNSIDPLTIIDEYSADALRFSLMMLTATGQDVYVSNEKFEIGRNFGTKIWNAARFMQMHDGAAAGRTCRDPQFDPALLERGRPAHPGAAARGHRRLHENLERFRFNDDAKALYEFLWHQFCDWYVEYSKEVLYGDGRGAPGAGAQGDALRVLRRAAAAASAHAVPDRGAVARHGLRRRRRSRS